MQKIIGVVLIALGIISSYASKASADINPFILSYHKEYQPMEGITRLTGFGYWEGERFDVFGEPHDYGDVAISPDQMWRYSDELDRGEEHVIDASWRGKNVNPKWLHFGDKIIIWQYGWFEGIHVVNDITASWIKNTCDLFVISKPTALKITGRCWIWKVVTDDLLNGTQTREK